MRVASGAVVCGMRLARGSHGFSGSDFVLAYSAVRGRSLSSRAGFSVLVRTLTRLSDVCLSGLLVRRTSTSLSLTSRLSMRRSPMPGPDCLRVCDVEVRLSSGVSVLKLLEGTRGLCVDAA